MIKSRGMRWLWYLSLTEEVRNAYTVLIGKNLKGKELLEDMGVDGKIILKWVLNEMGGCGLVSSGSG
jgi:hypothetical protein